MDDERAEAAEAEQRAIDFAQRAEEAAREAAAAYERHRTLRSTVGAAVAELQRCLAETAEAQRIRETDQKDARQRHAQADREASRAEGRIEQLEKDLAEAVDARAKAIAALQRFTATGLVAVALPEVTVPASDDGHWAATPAIAFARAIDSGLVLRLRRLPPACRGADGHRVIVPCRSPGMTRQGCASPSSTVASGLPVKHRVRHATQRYDRVSAAPRRP
ncbi:hypothetical protein ACWD4K_13375 [Streptomyces gelaticus]